ncbi:MAG: hypothetical protein JXO22_18395 [Phycisphaerae bacterium]|nr:hypothetical protein [Phycisphaerae bacterium]
MNAIVETNVRWYLKHRMHYKDYDCGAILFNMRELARAAGHELDERFRHAGLSSGPEGRIAAGLVDLAMGGGGCETPEYAIRQQINEWLIHTPPMGN